MSNLSPLALLVWLLLMFFDADATASGVDSNFAFYTLSILNAGSVFGRVIPNVWHFSYNAFSEA